MADKQIKDGIDVSQCECYSVEDNSCNDTLSGSCMKEKCQTFRLLQTIKAKEQENEGLKEQLTILDDEDVVVEITVEQFEEYKKLKAENDTLKQLLSKEPLALQALQSAYSSYKKSTDVFYEMVKGYKQTLTEIKEIVEQGVKVHDDIIVSKQILQKISEVIHNDNLLY